MTITDFLNFYENEAALIIDFDLFTHVREYIYIYNNTRQSYESLSITNSTFFVNTPAQQRAYFRTRYNNQRSDLNALKLLKNVSKHPKKCNFNLKNDY